MKINKKLKNTFISSLTLIAFATSVVACNKNKKKFDPNYKEFIDSVYKNIFKDEKTELNFLSINSSLKELDDTIKNFVGLDKYKINISLNKSFDPNSIFFYYFNELNKDIKPLKLSDFNHDGGITKSKDNKIEFNKNNQKMSIEKLIFAANFDVTIKTTDKTLTKSKEVTFNQATAFFRLNNINQDFKVNFEEWKNISFRFNPINDFDIKNQEDTKLKFQFHKSDLGFKNNPELDKNGRDIVFGNFPKECKYSIHSSNFSDLYFSIDENTPINVNIDEIANIYISVLYKKCFFYFQFASTDEKCLASLFTFLDISHFSKNNPVIVSDENNFIAEFVQSN